MQTFGTIAQNASEAAYPHLWKGLVGAWVPSLGVTGDTLRDVSGHGNNGTLTGMDPATDWQVDGGGWCLDFDGSNDYVSVGNVDELNGTDELTIAYWCRKPSAGTIATCGSQLARNNGFWLSWYSDGNIYWGTHNAGGGTRWKSLAYQDKWFHICGTYNGTAVLQLYVNGRVRSTSGSGTPPATLSATAATQFRVGSLLAESLYTTGKLSGVTLHNRALAPAEVATLYQAGPGDWLKRKRRRVYSIPSGVVVYGQRIPRHRTILGGGLR